MRYWEDSVLGVLQISGQQDHFQGGGGGGVCESQVFTGGGGGP